MTTGDMRHMPFEDDYFDTVTCVSTIEHVGHDNSRYGSDRTDAGQEDVVALAEVARVVRPGGRVLITVPFGPFRIYSWSKHYDMPA